MKIKVFIFLFFILFFIEQKYVFSQPLTQNIRGKVIDKDTKVSLPGANVIILNSNPLKGCVTDLQGGFKIENVPLGRQSVKVSFLGYEDFLLTEIEISSAKEIFLNIELKENVVQSNEVIITAKHIKNSTNNNMSVVSSRSFSVEETNKYAGSWGDPSRMASNFAGVSIVSDKRNDIIVRGNSPMSVLWKLDGIEIPNPNHFAVAGSSGGAICMINNNLLDNSDFHTGAFAAEYSNALSAVFDLKLRNGNNEKREYLAQAGVNGFEGGAEGPFIKGKNASYLINYRYSTLTILDKFGISIIEAIPNFQDISYKLNFPLKKGNISFFGIAGLSSADYKPEKNTDFLTLPKNRMGYVSGTKMGIAAVSFHHLLNSKTYVKINISTSAYNPYDGSDSTGLDMKVYDKYYSEYIEHKNSFNTIFNTKINNRNIIRWGGSIQFSRIINNGYYFDYTPVENKHIISTFEGNLSLANIHFQWMYNLSPDITLTTGLNAMQLFLNNKKCIEPRLGFKWDFLESNSITAGFGMHHQTQPYAIYFLETTDSSGNTTLPNKFLDFSQSTHFVLGYNRQLSENMRFKIETFYQLLDKIPISYSNPYYSLINFATDDNILNNSHLISNGKGYNYGLETTIEKFMSKGSYFLITASVFESKYIDGYNKVRNTRFNTNFLLSALAGKDLKFSFQKNSVFGIHSKFSYIGGQRFIPIDVAASNLQGNTVYIDSLSYVSQFPPFIKLDLRLRYRLNRKSFSSEFAIDVTNIFNRKNVETQRYDPYLQNIRYEYNLSRIPVVFIKIEF